MILSSSVLSLISFSTISSFSTMVSSMLAWIRKKKIEDQIDTNFKNWRQVPRSSKYLHFLILHLIFFHLWLIDFFLQLGHKFLLALLPRNPDFDEIFKVMILTEYLKISKIMILTKYYCSDLIWCVIATWQTLVERRKTGPLEPWSIRITVIFSLFNFCDKKIRFRSCNKPTCTKRWPRAQQGQGWKRSTGFPCVMWGHK